MSSGPVIRSVVPLRQRWGGRDPFLFMAHHLDHYPTGDGALAPVASLEGRESGSDFSGKDGWSMYHGGPVPGFPAHPHRGFETITIVPQGYVDHADSVGGRARFGMGDVQWLTAGAGVVHSEMFPLLHTGQPNPLNLLQIWLNLPAARKAAAPYFTIFWADRMPVVEAPGGVRVRVVAGELDGHRALAPPPDSWACDPRSDMAIWTITLPAGAAWTAPAAASGDATRSLHLVEGERLQLEETEVQGPHTIEVRPDAPVRLRNTGATPVRVLLLQARPIAEPVAAYGPFVMNTQEQIRQAFADYQRTRFGGWPYPDPAPTHGSERSRFAVFPDGREERPDV